MHLPLEKYLLDKSARGKKKKATAHITLDFWLDLDIQVVFRKHRSGVIVYESSPLQSFVILKSLVLSWKMALTSTNIT